MAIEEKLGLIYQAISGFYYVWAEEAEYVTRARGVFRHQKIKPLVGDQVRIEVDPSDLESEARLVEILPRKNQLVRPPIANVDYAFVVCSLIEPSFSAHLLDYLLVSVEAQGIQPIILLTKYDLLVADQGIEAADDLVKSIMTLYGGIGYASYLFDKNPQSESFVQEIRQAMKSGIYVVMGQSGVGKSTFLNRLIPNLDLATQSISKSLNRGKHTTREVTLYAFEQAYLADTPGFSSINFDSLEKEGLGFCFPEIHQASQFCRFRSCMHINEPHCEVKDQLESGQIAQSRYDSYQQILQQITERKQRY